MSQTIGKFKRTIKLPPAIGDWTTIDATVQHESASKIRSVKPANFDSLDRDTMKVAHRIQYSLGELICKKLSHDMDIKIELHTVTATQMTYSEFVKQTETSQVIQADLVLGTGDRINLLLDWPLAEQMVNRLTGGTGSVFGSSEFTSLEAGILETQLAELVQLLSTPWKNPTLGDHTQFEFSAGSYEINRKVSPRDAYIIFEYELILGFGGIHRLVWAYPNPLIRSLLTEHESASVTLSQTLVIDDSTLSRSYLPAKVVLGESKIAMGVLANLEEGDIIKLDSSIEDPLKLIIGDSTTLHIQPGVINNRFAAQVILWDGPQPKPTRSNKPNGGIVSNSPLGGQSSEPTDQIIPQTGLFAGGALGVAAALTDDQGADDAYDLPSPSESATPNGLDQPEVGAMPSEPFGDDGFDFDDASFTDSSSITTQSEAEHDPSFDTDDLFSDQYELAHEDSESDEAVGLFGDDDDDDFSWEDLENEA